MNNIQSHSLAGGGFPRQHAMDDPGFSSYVKKQSLSSYESLDAGLTIKTKEGDLVTLTSSSYAQMDSYMYDSKGILKTESGAAAVTQNVREINLETGESFSFTVAGDLSEEELADIEAIVKGIDGIISEVAEGDMEDAVSKAMSMGGYDTVSMYAADITYQKSYSSRTEVQSQRTEELPERQRHSRRNKNDSIQNMNRFFEKMTKKLENYETRLLEKAQKPVDKLFRHHIEDEKEKGLEKTPKYRAIEYGREKVSKWIDKMVDDMLKGKFSAFME